MSVQNVPQTEKNVDRILHSKVLTVSCGLGRVSTVSSWLGHVDSILQARKSVDSVL